MAATEETLGELHKKVAEVLSDALDGEELPAWTDPETGVEQPAKRLAPSAAIIAAATKFLKDNEITCDVSNNKDLQELEDKMAKRRAMRPSAQDFLEASSSANFKFGG